MTDYNSLPPSSHGIETAADLEHWLVTLQEQRVASFVSVAAACLVAVENNNVLTATKLFGQRAGWVRRRATVYSLICDVFDTADFLPQVPLSLYETAAKTNDPCHWLRMATSPAYRQKLTGADDGLNVWSARHLADMAGLSEGKTVSDVPLLPIGTEASVAVWEDGHIELMDINWEPSGKKPNWVKLGKIVEVLK